MCWHVRNQQEEQTKILVKLSGFRLEFIKNIGTLLMVYYRLLWLHKYKCNRKGVHPSCLAQCLGWLVGVFFAWNIHRVSISPIKILSKHYKCLAIHHNLLYHLSPVLPSCHCKPLFESFQPHSPCNVCEYFSLKQNLLARCEAL